MASMNYFDSIRKHLAHFFKYKSVMEIHVITKSTNLHVYSCVSFIYFAFLYIDDVISLNNSRFGEFVDRVYPIELEIKDTTNTGTSVSYLDLHLVIDSGGRLRTKHYDKRDDLNFPIVNFPIICSNIPAAPAYGEYISVDTIF